MNRSTRNQSICLTSFRTIRLNQRLLLPIRLILWDRLNLLIKQGSWCRLVQKVGLKKQERHSRRGWVHLTGSIKTVLCKKSSLSETKGQLQLNSPRIVSTSFTILCKQLKHSQQKKCQCTLVHLQQGLKSGTLRITSARSKSTISMITKDKKTLVTKKIGYQKTSQNPENLQITFCSHQLSSRAWQIEIKHLKDITSPFRHRIGEKAKWHQQPWLLKFLGSSNTTVSTNLLQFLPDASNYYFTMEIRIWWTKY